MGRNENGRVHDGMWRSKVCPSWRRLCLAGSVIFRLVAFCRFAWALYIAVVSHCAVLSYHVGLYIAVVPHCAVLSYHVGLYIAMVPHCGAVLSYHVGLYIAVVPHCAVSSYHVGCCQGNKQNDASGILGYSRLYGVCVAALCVEK